MADGGLGPDRSSVPLHDALDDGQADAGSLVVFGAMQALENPYQA